MLYIVVLCLYAAAAVTFTVAFSWFVTGMKSSADVSSPAPRPARQGRYSAATT